MRDLRNAIRTQVEARMAHVELTEGIQDGIDAITDFVLPVFQAASDILDTARQIQGESSRVQGDSPYVARDPATEWLGEA